MLQNDFFRPELAEDVSYFYLLNQIFESVSDIFAKEISKMISIGPLPVILFVIFLFYKTIVHYIS